MNKPDTTIVLPRSDPDLDGIACAVAYAELLRAQGRAALPWFGGRPDGEARYLVQRCAPISFATDDETLSADAFVLVDASGPEGIPTHVAFEKIREVIDHRLHHQAQHFFPNARIQVDPVGAAATLVAERFWQSGTSPTQLTGWLLYGAIYSNTQRLRGAVTTSRDRTAAQRLERECNPPAVLVDEQMAARRAEILADLPVAMRQETKQYRTGGKPFLVTQLEFEGAADVLVEREQEIRRVLATSEEPAILNMFDVGQATCYVLVPNQELREILSAHLGLRFNADIATVHPGILRKQIVAGIADS